MLKKIKGVTVAVIATGGLLVGQAHAALPASVTTAMGDADTDTKTLAGLAFAITLGIVVFKYFRRAL